MSNKRMFIIIGITLLIIVLIALIDIKKPEKDYNNYKYVICNSSSCDTVKMYKNIFDNWVEYSIEDDVIVVYNPKIHKITE